MKVRVVKMGNGANSKPKPLNEWYQKLKKAGYTGKEKVGDMQKWMVDNYPKDVVEYMDENPPTRNTNKGRNTYKKQWHEYTDEEKLDAFNDNLWDYRSPVPKDKNSKLDLTDPSPGFGSPKAPDEKPFQNNEGNNYDLKNNTFKKDDYKKRQLPFYQAAPDLAAFVSAQNTYNYFTPDYTHWETSPATLNIQPQLQDINASMKGVLDSTTGDPQIDNIRKQGAFTASLNAKQQTYANKQNYDANARLQADTANINARTNEQNLDIQATDRVHNNYRALAKDFAAGERLRAVNSLTKKYALNERNENKKKLWLDNFFPNVSSNGTDQMTVDGDQTFTEDYYDVNTKTPIPNQVKPATYTKPPVTTTGPNTFSSVPTTNTPGPVFTPKLKKKSTLLYNPDDTEDPFVKSFGKGGYNYFHF